MRSGMAASLDLFSAAGATASALVCGALAIGFSGLPARAQAPPAATAVVQATPVAQTADGPQLTFDSKTQTDTGVLGGDVAHYSFKVHNTGTKLLKILAVQPSCGCTVPSFDKNIEPGKTGVIEADVHTGVFWGPITKHLTVYSNDPHNDSVQLDLVVNVVPVISVTPTSPATIFYSELKPLTQVFTLESHRKQPMKLATPATQGPIKVDISQDAQKPNIFQVKVTLTPPPSRGDITGTIQLTPDVLGSPPIELMVAALDQVGIVVSPSQANFGVVFPGVKQPHSTVGIYSRKSIFHITKVVSDDRALTLQYSPNPSAQSWYYLTAKYNGGWKRGVHEGSLTVYTDLPMQPVVKVPYTADIQ